MEASEKLTIQALKAHDKVHPKFKSSGRSLKQKSRASLLSSPEDPAEVIEAQFYHLNQINRIIPFLYISKIFSALQFTKHIEIVLYIYKYPNCNLKKLSILHATLSLVIKRGLQELKYLIELYSFISCLSLQTQLIFY